MSANGWPLIEFPIDCPKGAAGNESAALDDVIDAMRVPPPPAPNIETESSGLTKIKSRKGVEKLGTKKLGKKRHLAGAALVET